MMRTLALALLLTLSACAAPQTASAPPPAAASLTSDERITVANYLTLKQGMTYEEVTAILGSETRQWLGAHEWWHSNGNAISLRFEDGKLVSKYQSLDHSLVDPNEIAVTPATNASGVTRANFLRLETGMSYEAVVEILGAPGSEISRSEFSGTVTVMYQWEGIGDLGANMNAMFQNNKLVSKAQFGLR